MTETELHRENVLEQTEKDLPVGTELRLIRPAEAERMLEDYRYPRQRKESKDYVSDLIYVLKHEQWKITTIELCELPDGQTYLTDGRHRLIAIRDSGIAAYLIIIRKKVKDAAELAEEYYRQDRGRTRSSSDAVRAYGINVPDNEEEAPELGRRQFQSALAAFNLIRLGFGWSKPGIRTDLHLRNQDKYVQEFHAWMPQILAYFEAVHGANPGLTVGLTASPCVAVGLVTFKYEPEKAVRFWTQAARSREIDSMGPIARVRESITRIYKKGADRPTASEQAKRIASSWNAFYRGDDQSKFRDNRSSTAPIFIEGTPYDGRTLITTDGEAFVARPKRRGSKKPANARLELTAEKPVGLSQTSPVEPQGSHQAHGAERLAG